LLGGNPAGVHPETLEHMISNLTDCLVLCFWTCVNNHQGKRPVASLCPHGLHELCQRQAIAHKRLRILIKSKGCLSGMQSKRDTVGRKLAVNLVKRRYDIRAILLIDNLKTRKMRTIITVEILA
jgi:hypothetical protein